MAEPVSVQPSDTQVTRGRTAGTARGPRSRVLLITTYPFSTGGLNTWCDTLVTGLRDVDFHVLGFVADRDVAARYTVPPNVRSLTTVALWGVHEVFASHEGLTPGEIGRFHQATTDAAVAGGLIPGFRSFVESILRDGTAVAMAPAIAEMHRFFLDHDFDTAMRSKAVSEAFEEITATALPRLAAARGCALGTLGHGDLTEARLRLCRWLSPASVRLPESDIVHAASGGPGVLAAVATKLERGTPFLLTEHGVYLRERYLEQPGSVTWLSLFTLAFMRRITELAYLAADQISPGSRFTARWAVRNGAGRVRVRIIPNGVDPATLTPAPRPPGSDAVVAWVGRITPAKDPMTLVRAALLVTRRVPAVRFRIYGAPPTGGEQYHQECLALRDELGLQSSVTFEGWVPSVEAAFNNGDVAVMSSITEGIPFTAIEAMLCGRPMVATAVGGIPEVLTGECGITVAPRDPEAMAAALLRVLGMTGDERAIMGRIGRDRAARLFGLDRSLDAYRESYLRLVARPVERGSSPAGSAATADEGHATRQAMRMPGPAAAITSAIDDLVTAVATRAPEPVDSLQVAAVLESMAVDDARAQDLAGGDVFDLAIIVLEKLRLR